MSFKSPTGPSNISSDYSSLISFLSSPILHLFIFFTVSYLLMVFRLQAGDGDKDFDSVWTTTEPNLVVQLVQSTSITLNMNPALTRYSNNIFI